MLTTRYGMVRRATFGGDRLVRELDTYNIRWRCCQATPDLGTT
jgi:hypothetical protein